MLENVELLIKVVECGNFTEAAKELNLAVSSVSRRIQKLEKRLGTQLFYRGSRKFTLTAEGEVYYSYMEKAVENAVNAEHAVRLLSSSTEGTIKIAAGRILTNRLLAPVFAEFLHNHPGTTLQVYVADEPLLFAPKDVDIIFHVGDIKNSELIATDILDDTLVLACSKRFLQRKSLDENSKKEILKNYITFPESYASSQRKMVDYEELGNDKFAKLIINDSESAYQMVMAGVGVSVLPRFAIKEEFLAGNVVELNAIFTPQPIKVHAIFQVPPSKSPRIKQFMLYVKNALAHC